VETEQPRCSNVLAAGSSAREVAGFAVCEARDFLRRFKKVCCAELCMVAATFTLD